MIREPALLVHAFRRVGERDGERREPVLRLWDTAPLTAPLIVLLAAVPAGAVFFLLPTRPFAGHARTP